MWYQVISYIKFILSSKNQHGVHSPFVFNLVTKCFYDKKKHEAYTNLNNYKNALLQNNKTISVTDFGSGSRVFKSNQRQVSKMAKYAGASKKEAQFLFRLVNYFKVETILELGTSLGIATQAIHLGNPNADITTIEGCPEISSFSKDTFNQFNLKNIELITGDFKEVLPTLTHSNYDLVYFDGNHEKEATLNYFNILLEKAHNNSLFIFDDIYWSKPMTQAWETIKKHPKVTVTIDTFSFGLVFFREEQAKEHFKIRL